MRAWLKRQYWNYWDRRVRKEFGYSLAELRAMPVPRGRRVLKRHRLRRKKRDRPYLIVVSITLTIMLLVGLLISFGQWMIG